MPDDPTRSLAPTADEPHPGTTGGPDAACTHTPDASDPAPAASPAAPPGYDLLEEIGRGGMGTVYRARERTLNRDVAVKLLQDRFPAAGVAARRFVDEAKITGQLQHPGIPPVHHVGELPDGRPFLAMKLIKGRTLADLLADRPADRGRLVAVFEAMCQAVGYAHAHHVIHRDLKPANVMVGAFGEVQVMDWGLAKVLAGLGREPTECDFDATTAGTQIESERDEGSETRAGSVLGTPAFMAPEQAIGAIDQIDARSDVFGLGAVLCAILTGKPPYLGADSESTRQLAAWGKLDDAFVRLDGCGADPDLVALCKRCLARDKAERPAQAGEVATAVADLRAAADERARQAELDRVRAEEKATEQRKRRKVQLALVAAVSLILLGSAAFAWWQDKHDRHRTAETILHQLKDEQRAAAERDRLGRNAEAIAALLDQCEEALRANDPAKAALALGAAEKRATEGGADDHTPRLDRLRADLAVLRDLDAVDQFRWIPNGADRYPDAEVVAGRMRAALERFGVNPAASPPDELSRRISGSPVRDRLLAALDWVLVVEASPAVRAALRVADPDPFRDAIRDALVAGDGPGLVKLADRPDVVRQPLGFIAILGAIDNIPVEKRRGLLVAAVQQRPGNPGLLMTLGGTYLLNQREGADARVRWYQAAVGVAPANLAAQNGLGMALHDMGDKDGAVAAYREAIRLDPKYAPAHHNLGGALLANKDLNGSVMAYREAIRLDPELAPAHYALGVVLRQKGDPDGAIAEFREAIRLDPKFARAHYALGSGLGKRGDPDGAIAAYREAIRIDPKYVNAHSALGAILADKGDLDGAITAYREVIRLDLKSAPAHNNLGAAIRDKGDLDGAITAFKEAIRLDPKFAPAHNNLGVVLWRKGDLDGAIVAFEEAIRLDARDVRSRVNLETIRLLKGSRARTVAPPPREVKPR